MLLIKSSFVVLMPIMLGSCLTNNSNNVTNVDSSNYFKIPRIIDTLEKTEELKKSLSINISYPNIETVKPFGDTCYLKEDFYNMWDTSINHDVDQRADGLQILVDTTQSITIKNDRDRYHYPMGDTTQIYYKGLPCFVYNETSQIKWLLIQDSRIIVIQEAKDSNYNWRPIQIWFWSWCGNSYYRAYIKPKHYLMFKIPLYAGDYYTDLRLKLYSRDAIYYSNWYKGWINYKQFVLPKQLMDDDGKPGFNLTFLTNEYHE